MGWPVVRRRRRLTDNNEARYYLDCGSELREQLDATTISPTAHSAASVRHSTYCSSETHVP